MALFVGSLGGQVTVAGYLTWIPSGHDSCRDYKASPYTLTPASLQVAVMKLRSHTRTSPPRSKFTTRYATTECSSEASCSYQDYGSEVEMDREKQRDQQEVDMFQEFEMYQQAMDEETMEYECAISGAEEVAMIQQEILHDEEMIWQEHLQNNVEEMEEMFEQQISGYGDSIWQDWTDTTAANIPR